MNGKNLDFTRLTNGTIPGGEVTQMYAQTDDYKSNLSIRWGKNESGNYDFDNPPSIKLELAKEDGDTEDYRAKDNEDLSKYVEGDKVYKVSGEIQIKASNKAARNANPEGGVLDIELQKKMPE